MYSKLVLSDTMVRENNITFPTDPKLCKKVIDNCNEIVEEEGLQQRRRYTRERKQLAGDAYNRKHPKRAQQAGKTQRRSKTIANTLLRELERKMNEKQRRQYEGKLSLYKQTVNIGMKTIKIKITAFINLSHSV